MSCSPLLAQHSDDSLSYEKPFDTTAPAVEEEEAGTNVYGEYIPEDTVAGPVKYNTAKPSDQQWAQVSGSDAYGYRDKKEYFKKLKLPPKDYEEPVWVKFLRNLYNFFSSTFGKFLLLAILVLIIGYIAYRIIAGQGGDLFSSRDRRKNEAANAEVSEQGLQEGAWEAALRKALEAGNTKEAVRFAWLHSLQLLQERSLITYRQDKTNIQYYRELAANLQPVFRVLSRQYETVWYGALLPDAAGLAVYMDTYKNLKKSIGA